ncbi:MAG: gliding motility protein GldN [Salinivirgaceae bacterium]|jgi:gliding motility associated protien GldN|nr:gliding motility protein GldN [Salinivirgaceae bacterium]
MKKLFLVPVLLLGMFLGNNTVAQVVLDDIYAPDHVPNRKPIPYAYLREADAMYKKRVWRVIDLREKINLNLYYPTSPIKDRMSLIDLLLNGIANEGVTAYNTDDDRFTQPMSRTQIDNVFDAVEKSQNYTDENGDEQTVMIKGEITSSEVKQYWLKEDWFFDRKHSTMNVRILGICPIRFYVKDGDEGEDAEMRKTMAFWIYFPEVRRILADHEVFNNNNDAERRTFDDIFFKRYFNSFIVKVSNVYDDRSIQEYSLGIQSLLEAEALKKQITDYEQDLWEY